jgi:acetyl esterase/lipase
MTTTRLRMPLWDEPAPHAEGGAGDEPEIEFFLPEPRQATGSMAVLLPGGGYTFLSEKSGADYGKWLAEHGMVGVVLHFRLGSRGYRWPALLADGWRALQKARELAPKWEGDPCRVSVIGTSAGGHLAALLLTGATVDGAPPPTARPALGVLCYPVITLRDPLAHQETRANFLGEQAGDEQLRSRFSADLLVDAETPPCFLWHTLTDEEVPAAHTQAFAAALEARGTPFELHLYGQGAHALGLAWEEGLSWSTDCIRWLRHHGF